MAGIARRTGLIAGWAALALVLCEGLTLALQTAVLTQTLDLPVGRCWAPPSRRPGW